MIDDSLMPVDAALEAFEVEFAHRPLVRQVALRAGISGAEVKASYVKLIRVDGLPPLHVTRRGIERFASQVEAVAATGMPDAVWSKVNRAGVENWGVTFPRAEAPASSSPTSPTPTAPAAAGPTRRIVPPALPVERDYGVCETCWQSRTAAGSCGCDD
ncbi:MAG: hypothetical protein ACLGHM_02600 [Actinomycetes bacterium]